MRHLVLLTALFATACTSDPRRSRCDPECGEFQECVDGVCRDQTCRPPCREGRACVRGYCLRVCDPEVGTGCTLSETCCTALRACVDVGVDFYNCNQCGRECPEGRSNACIDGQCACAGYSVGPCAEGYGCCEDGCKDLAADPENCGSCGHSCGGLQCTDGECRCSTDEPCPEGQECCPDGCRDLSADIANCGGCGNPCGAGEDCCGGSCVNTLTDAANCGDCGQPCAEGSQCCLGTCADTRSDPFNCGECLNDCGSGGGCVDGQCT